MLHNSVPYDRDEMKCIEIEIMSRIERQSNDSYCTSVQDVINAVAHLKVGKSDGSEVRGQRGQRSEGSEVRGVRGQRGYLVTTSLTVTNLYVHC